MYYNSFQYSFKVWLTSALAIPHVYLLYYMVTNGAGASLPIFSYVELLLETLLLSIPVGIIFMIVMDMMGRTDWSVGLKKSISLAVLEMLLLLLFTIIIHGIADKRTSWSSCFDYVVISSFTMAVCIYLYKLKPENRQKKKLSF